MRRLAILLLPLGLTLGSCSQKTTSATMPTTSTPAAAPDPAQLNGTWLVQSVRGQSLPVAASPEAVPQLTFDPAQNRVTGFTGCNRFFGSYTATGTSLRLGKMGTTLMACPDSNPEAALLAALNTPDLTYQLTPTDLTLLQGTTPVVVLRRAGK